MKLKLLLLYSNDREVEESQENIYAYLCLMQPTDQEGIDIINARVVQARYRFIPC